MYEEIQYWLAGFEEVLEPTRDDTLLLARTLREKALECPDARGLYAVFDGSLAKLYVDALLSIPVDCRKSFLEHFIRPKVRDIMLNPRFLRRYVFPRNDLSWVVPTIEEIYHFDKSFKASVRGAMMDTMRSIVLERHRDRVWSLDEAHLRRELEGSH